MIQDPHNLQRGDKMFRPGFSHAEATTNCGKPVLTQELLLCVFDIQVACLAHIYHKTPDT